MNRRIHLMERISRHLEFERDEQVRALLLDALKVLQYEEDISDLESQIDILERGLNGILPYFPDSDIRMNGIEDEDDEE
jgi:hypothetical protein